MNENNGKEKVNRWWLKYLITFGIGSVISVLLMWYFGLFAAQNATKVDIAFTLCDAFFIPGILILALGALVFASRNGAFDMLVYAVKYVFTLHFRRKDEASKGTFYDYKTEKAGKEKTPCLYLVIVGLVFLAAAGICLLLFYKFSASPVIKK